ncbi:GSCOCT00000003001.3-RA-CDS [Cotesia congregata]|uniref:Odorant receptor n=1 Tax=Cotesia congregata TaxID=51543 RepID=A0A8J2MNQ5_COTCN|nr:GSCOCT00000003001.3-RA-CDS [Cotesia congregata]CAG5100926.1 olfactory receptor 4 [Cotesia congregata]
MDCCRKKISHSRRSNTSKNMHNALKYTYWFLNIIAIWQLMFQSLNLKKLISIIHVFIVCAMFIWQLFVRCYHMYFYATDLNEQVTLLAPIAFIFVVLLKYIAIVYRHKTIMKSIEHIRADWSATKYKEEKEIMAKNTKISNNITFIFSILMYTSGTLYNFFMPHVIPLLFRNNNQNTSERLIIFPGYNIISLIDSSPFYEITFFFHAVAIFFCFTVLVSTCNITIILVTHANSQIQIAIVKFKSLINDFYEGAKFSNQKISIAVQHHVRVLEFSKTMLREALLEYCLIEIGASSILLCIDEFCFLRMLDNQDIANTIPYIMLFFALSLNILILCYFSELLNSEFIEVGNQLYMTEWYKIPSKARRYFILIINMSQRPQRISAGGIIDLSYITYIQIIKTGFAYLQILRASNTH